MMKREDILISFIHTPTDGKPNQPIDPIRIMKGLFLLKMEMGDKLSEFYNFEPYLYGPCSFEVYEDIEKLISERMLDKLKLESFHSWDHYRLTRMGEKRADEISKKMVDLQTKIKEIKKLVVSMEFMDLLRYVYKKYPDYAKLSIIAMEGVNK